MKQPPYVWIVEIKEGRKFVPLGTDVITTAHFKKSDAMNAIVFKHNPNLENEKIRVAKYVRAEK